MHKHQQLTTKFFFILLFFTLTTWTWKESCAALYLQSEEAPQDSAYLVFGASNEIYNRPPNWVTDIQKNLALIANTVAAFQPVQMIVRSSEVSLAQSLIDPAVSSNISLIEMQMNDIWARDTLPVFVRDDTSSNSLVAVGLNFNGWGGKQDPHDLDALLAENIASYNSMPFLRSILVGEGGGLEVDGDGTMMLTESSWINPNRNPGMTKEAIEQELSKLFGIEKFIWLPGSYGGDITDAHIDYYARFVRPGQVLVHIEEDSRFEDYVLTRQNLAILQNSTDAKGRQLQVRTVSGPTKFRPGYSLYLGFAPSYINYLVVNGGIVSSSFGDSDADAAAKSILEESYPDRKVIQLDVDAVVAGGGGIHCVTMQQPSL